MAFPTFHEFNRHLIRLGFFPLPWEEEGNAERSESPIPANLREISSLASWTVSSHKPGNGVAALRHPSPLQYWQSDGPQPHTLTLHFFKLVCIVKIRVYLDFELDESYTPTKMVFYGGMGGNDLVEFATWQGDGPCGWVDIPLEGVGGSNRGWGSVPVRRRSQTRRHRRRRGSRRSGKKGRHGPFINPSVEDGDDEGRIVPDMDRFNNKRKGPTSVGRGDLPGYGDGPASSSHHYDQNYSSEEHFSDDDDDKTDEHEEGDDDEVNTEEEDDAKDPYAGNVLKAMVVQMRVLENHQNGKDTHVRGFQVFAVDTDRRRLLDAPSASASAASALRRQSVRKSLRPGGGRDDQDHLGQEDFGGGKMTSLEEPDWMGEPVIR